MATSNTSPSADTAPPDVDMATPNPSPTADITPPEVDMATHYSLTGDVTTSPEVDNEVKLTDTTFKSPGDDLADETTSCKQADAARASREIGNQSDGVISYNPTYDASRPTSKIFYWYLH